MKEKLIWIEQTQNNLKRIQQNFLSKKILWIGWKEAKRTLFVLSEIKMFLCICDADHLLKTGFLFIDQQMDIAYNFPSPITMKNQREKYKSKF